MKKPLAAALLLALLLTACGGEAAQPTEAPATVALTTPATATPITVPETKPPAPEVAITWVNNSDTYYPVSYRVDGAEQLSGHSDYYGWYDWILEKLDLVRDAPQPEVLTVVDTATMYADGTVPELHSYQAHLLSTVVSNGEWEFFPAKVRYEAYTLENQPQQPEWTAYFSKLLAEESPQTPIIFEGAWFFDWLGDGGESAVVSVNNTVWHGADLKESVIPNPPPVDGTVLYEFAALFPQGGEPVLLGDVWTYPLTLEPLDDDHASADESYRPPAAAAAEFEYYGCYYSAIQWDGADGLMVCPVYEYNQGWEIFKTAVLVCDIDGDGAAELLTQQSVVYAPIQVFKLIDGTVQEVFSINTFAKIPVQTQKPPSGIHFPKGVNFVPNSTKCLHFIERQPHSGAFSASAILIARSLPVINKFTANEKASVMINEYT